MPLINNIQNGFGLDIGDRSIKLLRLEAKKTFLHKKKFIVKTFAEIEVPEGAIERGEIKNESAVVSSLKSLLKEAGKLPSKTAVVSLPETKTFLKTIKIVAKEKKELQAKIIDMLPQTLPVSLEEIYFDWQIIETKEIEDRETEEQRDRRTEGQKNRGTEEQRNRRTKRQRDGRTKK